MKLVSAPSFVKLSELSKGDVIFERAVYTGTKENTASKYKGSLNHSFDEEGTPKVVGGNVKLNDLIDTHLVEGDLCKLVYKGKTEGKNGNAYHDFDLYVEETKPLKKVSENKSVNLDDLE